MKKSFPLKVEFISELIEAEFFGDSGVDILGINRIENLENGEIAFYSDTKFEDFLKKTENSFFIVPKNFDENINLNNHYFKVENPYQAFVKLILFIDSQKEINTPALHETSIIDSSSSIDESTYVGPGCIIGKNCKIGKNVVLHSKVVLYDDISIEDGTFIHTSVKICSDTKIGQNCIIHPGAVIGSDGFGFIENKDKSYTKIPQIGNVIIGNNVEIGANTTVDRALVGSTIIRDGVKIDNLCQIAHNVEVGEHTGMAAQVGIAGSSKIGKRNRLGGQVGLAGHLELTDDIIVLAQSGVPKDVAKKGIYFGSPIRDRLQAFKIETALNHLPDLVRTVERLRKKLED